jgi:hypothetical protein
MHACMRVEHSRNQYSRFEPNENNIYFCVSVHGGPPLIWQIMQKLLWILDLLTHMINSKIIYYCHFQGAFLSVFQTNKYCFMLTSINGQPPPLLVFTLYNRNIPKKCQFWCFSLVIILIKIQETHVLIFKSFVSKVRYMVVSCIFKAVFWSTKFAMIQQTY